MSLRPLGTTDLGQVAAANAAHPAAATQASTAPHHAAPLGLLHSGPPPAAPAAGPALPRAQTLSPFGGNVAGESGIDGITAAINGGANSPDTGGVGDLTPPDQGLAVGPSPAGTVLVEFVNTTLNIYSPSGTTLLGALPAWDVFGGGPSNAGASLSDPRAYWDPSTGHWFLAIFTYATSGTAPVAGECAANPWSTDCSTQFIAVSDTTNPFGAFTVFAIDTTDEANSANGCPCFGDYDMVGADGSGFYVSTNEFPAYSSNFNGAVIYAMSRSGLIAAANGGPTPVVQRYTVPYAGAGADPFAGYHLSPSTVTQGSSSPDTEYFVESDANLPNASSVASALEVFALLQTSQLGTGGRPTLVMTTVATESYTGAPPNALQESGPTPLGTSVGFSGTTQLETDFNAVQEVTYAGGLLYAELSTGFAYGAQTNAGAAWFVLAPTAGATSLSVTDAADGTLETTQDILYPVIGVDASGLGYMAFAVSGPTMYPSAAYVTFDGTYGAGGTVHVAAAGVDPLDTFDCYPYFGLSTGQCRYGDYSMAQAYGGEIYMGTEYVAPEPRDVLANWATRLYWAPDSPDVAGVSPSAGPITGATAVTITGTGFSAPATVDFGATPATGITVVSPTEITASSPPGSLGTVDVTVTTAGGTSPTGPSDHYTYLAATGFHGESPVRVADSRGYAGNTYQLAGHSLSPGKTVNVAIAPDANGDGVPASATAVVANVTATDPTAQGGYLTVWPAGQAKPPTSTLNFAPGETVANLVELGVGSGGAISVYNSLGTTDVVVDVEGWVGPDSAASPLAAAGSGLLRPLTPARIADSRGFAANPYQLAGHSLTPAETVTVQVTGHGGVPASGVSAVVANVTVTGPSAQGGYLTIWPEGPPRPTASNVNFTPGDTVANRVLVALGPTGRISIYNALGTTDVIVDVGGFFTDGSVGSQTGAIFTPLAPERICDTRTGQPVNACSGQSLGASSPLKVAVAGLGGVPTMGSSTPPVALVANVTATDTTAWSYFTAWPDGVSQPLASDLNFTAGASVPNLVVVKLGADGSIDVANAFGSADLIVDVTGYYVG